jgi:hypothetical protein
MRVFVGSGCATPQRLVAALAARASGVYDVEIIHLLTFGAAPYAHLDVLANFRHNAFFIGPNVRDAVYEGVAGYTPVHLSEIPALFRSRRIHLDFALIQVSPPDAHGFCSLGVSVDVVKAAVESMPGVTSATPRPLGVPAHTAHVAVPMRRPPATPVVNFPKYNTMQMRPHEQAQVFADVSECATRLEREARRNPAFPVLSWSHSTVDFDPVGRVFGGSMGERGYSVRDAGQDNR